LFGYLFTYFRCGTLKCLAGPQHEDAEFIHRIDVQMYYKSFWLCADTLRYDKSPRFYSILSVKSLVRLFFQDRPDLGISQLLTHHHIQARTVKRQKTIKIVKFSAYIVFGLSPGLVLTLLALTPFTNKCT
jgi:hypothetical protein